MFHFSDTHNGVLRLWSVSKTTPIENIKLKKTGFHALHVLHTTPAGQDGADNGSPGHHASPPASYTAMKFALPPAHALCTFMDGGVGLYDLGRRKWNFLRDQGHIETIFDCKFHPEDPDLLATGRYGNSPQICWILSFPQNFEFLFYDHY